ncbi:MAG TPA: hypothetical protein VF263_20725 [Longimicrobiaceae bacterium]
MRRIQDDQGRAWEVVAVEARGAHMRMGALLGFRPADEPGETIVTTVSFNSDEAAEFAIRTMGEKELGRRLAMARTMAGRV